MRLAYATPTIRTAKIIFALLVALAAFAGVSGNAGAESASPIKVFVDTKRIPFTVDPLLEDGTTLVQLRPLFEAMGITLNWDNENRIVNGSKDGLALTLKIDSARATVNGKETGLEKAARLVDGNTLVPLRFVGEATGAIVVWDGNHREITVFTEQMLQKLGLSREQLEQIVAERGMTTSGSQPPNGSEEADPNGGSAPGQSEHADVAPGEEETPADVPADLDRLQGMYYGFRADPAGFECGGACWDYYTFLPDNKVVIGEPEKGGPETVDCGEQSCSGYSIKDGNLVLDNGKTYPIRVSDKGNLFVDDVQLSPVRPVADNLTLEGAYAYRGYSGFSGINAVSSAWENRIAFQKDGTFESDDTMMGTSDTEAAATHSSASSGTSGTYAIKGNTLVLKFEDGKEQRYLFFLHPGKDGKPNPLDVQIGDRNFYVDQDK